jgi:hypothetical protein
LETLPPIFHPHSANAHPGSENYGKYLFGGQLANVISELPNGFIAAQLEAFKAESPENAKRAPSIATAKAVLKEYAQHTTTRPRNGVAAGQPWVAETIPDMCDYLAYGKDQIKNPNAFLIWSKFLATLKKGSDGRATLRQVRLPDPALLIPYLSGREMPRYVLSIENCESGKAADQSGKVADQGGSSPATPRVIQDLSKPRKPAPRSNAARGKRESCQSCGGTGQRHQPGVGWIPNEKCRECKPPPETWVF